VTHKDVLILISTSDAELNHYYALNQIIVIQLQMELTKFRGTLALCGPELAEYIQRLAPGAFVESE
jgi:hypothetical protein